MASLPQHNGSPDQSSGNGNTGMYFQYIYIYILYIDRYIAPFEPFIIIFSPQSRLTLLNPIVFCAHFCIAGKIYRILLAISSIITPYGPMQTSCISLPNVFPYESRFLISYSLPIFSLILCVSQLCLYLKNSEGVKLAFYLGSVREQLSIYTSIGSLICAFVPSVEDHGNAGNGILLSFYQGA